MNKNLCPIPECRNYLKYCRLHKQETFTPVSPVKKVSDQMKEQLKKYRAEARKFITAHPRCQVKGCTQVSECVHHMAGRVGENLTNQKTWLAVCLSHHRQIEDNPDWAKQNGYSESRLKESV